MPNTKARLEKSLGRRLSGPQADLAPPLYELYAREGLIRTGEALPLADACRCGAACWRREDPNLVPEDKAGVSLPWIGDDYAETRVCVLGINFRCDGGLDAHWRLTESVIAHLKAGRKRVHGSTFGYRAGLAAASVMRALASDGTGRAPTDLSPPLAAQGWSACAFLQLVKCAPCRGRSEPNETMWANCPNIYLAEELHILAPKILLVLGSGEPDNRLRSLGLVTRWEKSDNLQRGKLEVSDLSLEVLAIPHPSARRRAWETVLAGVTDSIEQDPPDPDAE